MSLLGACVTFQYRAVVRELGKVFGLPKREIDRLAAGNVDVAQLDETVNWSFATENEYRICPIISVYTQGAS